jgi:hypothetical protein
MYRVWNVTDDVPVLPDPVTEKQGRRIIAGFPGRYAQQGYYKTAEGDRIDPARVVLELRPEGGICPGCGQPYTGNYWEFAAGHACPNCPTRSYDCSIEEDGETGAPCRDADPQGQP